MHEARFQHATPIKTGTFANETCTGHPQEHTGYLEPSTLRMLKVQHSSTEELNAQLNEAKNELSALRANQETLMRTIEEAAMHGVAERIDKVQRLNWPTSQAHWYACRATLLELANQLPMEFGHAHEALLDVLTMEPNK